MSAPSKQTCGMPPAAGLCLSRSEVAELCGTPQRARQAAFLRKNGIRHYLDAHDWPVVLRAAIDAMPPSAVVRPVWKSNKVAYGT
ncbi:DUF4224 domain-containing protein [Xylella fastidiosa subsp. fastidiosa]|uniref:DUF4224 domain-containing protein n=3 Tax=Xylella fastidiosa TaxID=2371 RepID=Q87ED4_XYLFT|nr:DUF4224 domain-containing protein [Xylella fastidiosa]ADN63374.1 hypothetical protein XFLM_07300 [Xylella fastidiosa subsp. fastidiosa GB514]AAO28263.1 conserved hypothetical protein [Xylella fastidiosa Temecula1]ACB91823.1 hypothetical protein XfasM23_0375 [Xylella fastidiosa M23]MDC7963018.1 DUF4224 domain-containing protein [Xylella fastidiosa]NBI38106.1 DUF4224 domain-containing protein [Xylella fastidiosa subsp. fastidiosa]